MNYQQMMEARVKKGKNVFIADTARVLGNVQLGDDVSVWFGAVIRGDNDSIEIGDRTNIQECCVLHVDHHRPVRIGADNIIGHGAIVHGATLGNFNLVGMHATILNGAVIGDYCIIGANALVTEGMVVPDGSMVLGVPGKIVRQLPVEKLKALMQEGVDEYVTEARKYLGLVEG